MIAVMRKTYWMMIQAVRAEIPTATGGLELTVETRRVVRERKRVTRRDIRPGITWDNILNIVTRDEYIPEDLLGKTPKK